MKTTVVLQQWTAAVGCMQGHGNMVETVGLMGHAGVSYFKDQHKGQSITQTLEASIDISTEYNSVWTHGLLDAHRCIFFSFHNEETVHSVLVVKNFICKFLFGFIP